ncbi:MAG TPA: LicD family protein, partial [Enterobacter roggenkampii]|nr:LicD family protein [Enterobacter roggenkampii]
IMMPRPDYEKLLQYLKENIAVYPHLQVFNPDECPDYPYMITRISDNRYVIDVDNEDPYGMGVFIDVYPYDGLGNSKKEALKFGLKGDRLSSLCYQATRRRFAIETTTSNVRKILKYPVYLYAKLRGKEVFQRKLAKLAGIKEYDESNYVGCVVWLSWGEKDIFPRKWFEETILVNFDKYKFRIPKEYDALLRYEYGDYMKLPPKKERVGHHNYKVYKK